MGYERKEILELLEREAIQYRVVDHPPVFTVQEMEQNHLLEHGKICKNLFLRNAKGDTHYLVCLPAEQQADLKTLATKLSSTKLSFASENRLVEHLGVTHGAVSPLGVLNDDAHTVVVAMDRALLDWEDMGVHPNVNTSTVWLRPDDLLKLIRQAGNPIQFI